jgi:tight adherence protein C
MSMLLALALALFGVAVYLVAELATTNARQRSVSIRRAATYSAPRLPLGPQRAQFSDRVIAPLITRLAGIALRLNPQATVESIRARLLSAGLGAKVTPRVFLAAKAGFALAFFLIGLVVGNAFGGILGGLVFALAWAAGGFALPGILLSSRTRKRNDKIRAELPDALDLLAVSVEAGLGFDGAVDKLTHYMDGPIAEEFTLTLGEMRIGESRHEALKKLVARVDTPEVAAFSRAIIQADQLGISLGRILKVQAQESRLRRQMAAEEKAMKAPIKMLFPTVAFIFPAMFIVVLGPALMSISKVF